MNTFKHNEPLKIGDMWEGRKIIRFSACSSRPSCEREYLNFGLCGGRKIILDELSHGWHVTKCPMRALEVNGKYDRLSFKPEISRG